MTFEEILDQAAAMLERRGRLTYGALKRQFQLDDDYLADLKAELIDGQRVAVDEDGKVLVWVGEQSVVSRQHSVVSGEKEDRQRSQITTSRPLIPDPQPPIAYTPTHLAERIRAVNVTDGERKTITALFADLKGSTALIEGLDPEDARAIIDPALQLMMDAVHQYDGYVAQALGDGIFALFGAPLAHEDHPQRALYAALRMQAEMRQYSDQLRLTGGIPLQMRVGINTGEVVMRSIRKDDLHTDYVPVGHSTNLAARMEQLATPGSIVISEYTRQLTEGYFELKAFGAATLKGVEAPLNVYEVLGAGPLRTRFQVTARRGLTRFVGRHTEMEQIQRALEQVKADHGQIVGVAGEPGLGKSRLFYEFKLTSQSGCLVLEAFSVSHGQASPYLPLIELLKTYFQIEATDDERQRKEKVGGKVLMLDRSLEDTLPHLFSLLGIEEQPSPLQQMDAQIRRRRTFEAVKKLFLRESLNQPLILVFEDLHWIDTETQGFLDVLSESVASAKVLLLVNYRPEYQHEWGQKTYYTQLRLAPLGQAEAAELLTFLLGGAASLSALKLLILEKTEGSPFFMEEVVQTLAEEGTLIGERGRYRVETTPTELHISPTVQGVLAARIDRLTPDEKALLQQLSVIGRQFPLSLVKHVVPQPEAELYRVMSALQAKEFLYEQPAFPEVEYLFKHALTQEVAYATLLQEQRKTLHERTGHAIETLYHNSLEDHYSALAHHYAHTDNTEKAIAYLGLAGHQAAQRSANSEAVTLLTQAVVLVQQQPTTPEHLQQELTLQTALGPLLIATAGYAAQETESAYTRAYALCEQVGEPAHLFPILWGLQQLYGARPDYRRARAYGEQMLALAQRLSDASLLVWAYRGLGEVSFCLGEFLDSTTHSEHRVAVSDLDQRRAQTLVYGEDPAVTPLWFYSLSLFALGYPDRALQTVREALTLAQDLTHGNSLAFTSNFAAWVHADRREPVEAREHAEAAIALATEQGLPNALALGTVLWGWALAAQGQAKAGIAEMRRGHAALRATGLIESNTYWLGLLAEAYGQSGQWEQGLRVLAEACAFMQDTEERFYEAELHRLTGELLLQQAPDMSPDAEACFQHALDVARQQQAKSWELRAATSLARLWRQQGKITEARDLLTPVYEWFTEGFATADLKDAKALLSQLSEGV